MTYMGDRLRYWEGRAAFPPQNVEVEVFVSCGKSDSLETQYEFYREFCRVWAELANEIGPKLAEVFEQANQKKLDSEVWKDFQVSSVSVPLGPFDTSRWTMGLDAKSDEAHTYWVEMNGRTPETVSWDS
jgi:hypothetical protein